MCRNVKCIFFYRHRQKHQVSNKDSLKVNKNRHDLYAEELVSPLMNDAEMQ